MPDLIGHQLIQFVVVIIDHLFVEIVFHFLEVVGLFVVGSRLFQPGVGVFLAVHSSSIVLPKDTKNSVCRRHCHTSLAQIWRAKNNVLPLHPHISAKMLKFVFDKSKFPQHHNGKIINTDLYVLPASGRLLQQ